MNEAINLNDFSVTMYDNSSVMFAILKIELDEKGNAIDWTHIYCNEAFANMAGGRTKDQLIGRRFLELAPDGDHKWLADCYEAAYNGKTSLVNDYSRELDKYLHQHIFPVGHEGYCAVMVEDFTAIRDEYRKSLDQARNEMRKTLDKEAQFRQATISNSMVVANLNITRNLVEDEIYERVDSEMRPLLQTLGLGCPCPIDALALALCNDRVGAQSREEFIKFFSQDYLLSSYEKGQLEHTMEYMHFINDKDYHIVRNTLLLIEDPASGDIIAFCNVKDVSQTRKKEEEYKLQLEQQTEELAEALSTVKSSTDALNTVYEVFGAARWTVEYDQSGQISSYWWSDKLRRMLGYTNEQDFPNNFDIMIPHIHPDDIEKSMNTISSISHDSSDDLSCDIEVRLCDKTGEYKWYRVVGKAVKRTDGTPETFYGVIADIDARKKTQLNILAEVDQTEKAYHTLHRLIKSGMWDIYYDENGKRIKVEWSDEFRHMIGYTDEDDFPNTLEAWSSLLHPDDWGAGYDTIEPAVFDKTGNTPYDVEYRLKTKDRGYRWFRATGDVYRRPDRSPYRFFGVFFDIDDQKRHAALEAERQAALETAQLASDAMEAIHESLGSGGWTMQYDETGQLSSVIWSTVFRRMLGFHDEKDFPNTFNAWFDRLHPEDKEPTLKAFNAAVEDYSGSTIYDVVYRLLTRDRGYRWFKATGSLSRRADGTPVTFHGLFVDVDERIRTAEELEESRKKQEEDLSMISGLSQEYYALIMIHTEDYRIKLYRDTPAQTLNAAVAMGKSEPYYEPFIKSYIENFVLEEDRERVASATTLNMLHRNISANGVYSVNFRRVNKDGADDYRQMAFSKAESEGKEEIWVFGFRDINRMMAEEQRQKKLLADALASAEHANRAKTVFLNNMSHDIRTPMNAIIGFTSLATSHIDNKEQVRDYLGKIATSSSHLLSLINDVLDMSRIESGKVKIEENEVHLPDIFHDLKTIVQTDIHSRQLEFFMDAVDIVNENIMCDKLRLNQVLLNLLSNAMKFTRPGGTVSMRVIQKPDAPSGYANYEFRIKDTGIGMSEEFMEKLFQPFEREQNSTTSGIQGTGLGLAITKNIVDMMGGTIEVKSEVGKGTEFIVSTQFRISGETVKYEVIPELDGLRALVADDDYHTCVSVTNMLGTLGMRSDWTTSGKEALLRAKLAMEQNDEFSAYVLDWLMPDMNGIELVRRLRRIIGEDKPIIILTAYDWTSIEDEAKEAGVTAFCSKPLFMSELSEVLTTPWVVRDSAGAEEAAAEDAAEDEEIDFTDKKILLVEDNELNREIAVEILTEVGFIVDTAEDGILGVEKMQAAEPGQYDLILMDVQMPKMDGYEATRRIRQIDNEEIASIPIIAMTANAFEEDKRSAFDAGMNDFLAKPIDIGQLFELLSKVLK